MTEKDKWQYNLRSGSNSVHLPVQIHMASEFVSKLASNQESVSSDLNCSALFESSDNEQNPSTQHIQSTSSTLVGGSALSDVATQKAINVQVLSQLLSISDRLNILEEKDVKKDSDPKEIKSSTKKKSSGHVPPFTLPQHQYPTLTMPNLQSIRQDVLIQSQVDQRLKKLSNSDDTGTKIKSLSGGPVGVVVPN